MCRKRLLGRTGRKHKQKKQELKVEVVSKQEVEQLLTSCDVPQEHDLSDDDLEEEVLKPLVRSLVEEVYWEHVSKYKAAYKQLVSAATYYNSIALAVRNLRPLHQTLALDIVDNHWKSKSCAMLALARTDGADVMGQGYCQLRGVKCECACLCSVCGKPQWDRLCMLWQRGKCECRIVGVTRGVRWDSNIWLAGSNAEAAAVSVRLPSCCLEGDGTAFAYSQQLAADLQLLDKTMLAGECAPQLTRARRGS